MYYCWTMRPPHLPADISAMIVMYAHPIHRCKAEIEACDWLAALLDVLPYGSNAGDIISDYDAIRESYMPSGGCWSQ